MPENQSDVLLSQEDCNPFIPKAALVVFSQGSYGSEKFLELREIRRDGSMGCAKPVSKDFLQNLLSSFSEEYRSIPHGAVPDNMLYCDVRKGRDTFLWYNPPMKRQRFFDARLNLEDGTYHVPGTLYLVREGKLSVFCFGGRKPDPDKVLLGVPYFNVYADGSVCMGSARVSIPDRDNLSYEDVMLAWERAFWYSKDVHTNGSPSTKANLIETIRKYKDRPFDASALEVRKDGLNLSSILRRLK